ncbi:MAG: hypothetical protein MZV64_15895, partial [Ignavibacteriales bacterium]|nr:hypothetical protein [Ignavibacteriales bacterium]
SYVLLRLTQRHRQLSSAPFYFAHRHHRNLLILYDELHKEDIVISISHNFSHCFVILLFNPLDTITVKLKQQEILSNGLKLQHFI